MTTPKHWQASDFVETQNSPAYDGSSARNRFGYCRVCKCDMQSFGENGKDGPLLHYKSRQYVRRAGLEVRALNR